MDKYIGSMLGGRYQIEEMVGVGGMAVVYRARDTILGRDVALKVLKKEFAEDPDIRKRFSIESRAVAKLSHHNIVSVFDVGSEDGTDRLGLRQRRTGLHEPGVPASAVVAARREHVGILGVHDEQAVERRELLERRVELLPAQVRELGVHRRPQLVQRVEWQRRADHGRQGAEDRPVFLGVAGREHRPLRLLPAAMSPGCSIPRTTSATTATSRRPA